MSLYVREAFWLAVRGWSADDTREKRRARLESLNKLAADGELCITQLELEIYTAIRARHEEHDYK
jgi:hypothetical protein